MVSLSDSHLILHAIIIWQLSILRGVHFASGVAWEFLNTMDIIRILCKLYNRRRVYKYEIYTASALPSLLPHGRIRLMLMEFIKYRRTRSNNRWLFFSRRVPTTCTFASATLNNAGKIELSTHDDPFTSPNQLRRLIRQHPKHRTRRR